MTWFNQAACKGEPSDLFFPGRGEWAAEQRVILEYCGRCPVRTECLEYGLKEPLGIWGGLTPRQRKKVRTERRRGQMALAL